MAKITIEELSDSLKEYLNGLGLTEAQVQELIDSFEEEKVGELTNLNTTNKENLVAAINEVFQSGNNVKQNLVDALIAKGVSCSTSDSFSKLISLIYGLTHGEGSEDNGNENLPSFEEENTWSTCNNMTVNRYALASAVVDKKIYVIGGYNSVYCNTLEVYDTELGIWETKTPMPTSLAYLSAETVNGKIYVLGGSNSTTHKDVPNEDYVLAANGKYRIYDPPTDTWTEVTKNMPIHQYESNTTGTSTAVIGDTIYFAGGHGEGARYNTIGSFNVTTGTTTLIGDQYGGMQNTGMAHSALCAIDGKLYRFGGKGYGTNSLNNTSGSNYILTYDPSNPSSGPNWLETYMPIVAHSMGYCVVNKKVYLIGGIQGSGTFYNNGGLAGTVHNTVYEYEPYTNKWNKVNTMLTPRFALTAAVVDNIIYCIGGMDSNKVPSNAVEAYCPPGVEPPSFGGGSSNNDCFNIITATELPEEVVNNQIVIISENEPNIKKIKDSSLSTPSVDGEMIVGIVSVPDDSGVEYIILQNGIIMSVYLKVAKSYFNGIVTTHNGYIGIGDNWVQFSKATLLVFDNGVDNMGINNPSNWTCINSTMSQGTWNLGINITGHGDNSWRDAAAWFNTKFDLTNYKTLKITGTASSSATVGFTKSPGTTASIEKSISLTTTSSEITVDVSSLSGEYYLIVKGRTATSTYSAFSTSRFELLP